MAITAEDRRRYKHVQGQIEAIVREIAAARGFAKASREPHTGKAVAISWEQPAPWKRDRLRLLFIWGTGYRQVHTDVSLAVRRANGTFVSVDGAPARWIARRSPEDLRIHEGCQDLPSALASTLRTDLIHAFAWLGDRYQTPALTLQAMSSGERNGVRIGSGPHREACATLTKLPAST